MAVPLFTELRRECTVPVARAALDRVLKDEVRRRQFGWDLLDYLLERTPSLAGVAQSFLPGALSRLEQRYGVTTSGGVSPAERAWDLMAPAHYGEVLEATVRKEYEPRFRERALR